MMLAAVGLFGGLTLTLASLLVLAARTLHVEEDPRIDVVEELLPHANCGACGQPGCRAFAEALVAGRTRPAACTVGSTPEHARIAQFLGIAVGRAEKRVARLACAGGTNVSRHHARYDGVPSCGAASLISGGGKGCFWGCLGLADCADACDFDAIEMDAHDLPIVDESRCTACGDCVTACPKDLFSIHPVDDRVWVACASLDAGDGLLEDCQVACTACGRCAQDAPGLVTMHDNLALVDYRRLGAAGSDGSAAWGRRAIRRCPTGAIVWLDPHTGPEKGPEARPVVRREARPDAPT